MALSAPKCSGGRWQRSLHPDDRDARPRRDRDGAERATLPTPAPAPAAFLRADGSVAWWEMRAARVRPGGTLLGSVALFTDVTERKRAEARHAQLEEQLRISQKMEAVGLLAGGIAHDFNNLLHVIGGFANLALMEQTLSASSRDCFAQIIEAVDRASQLTRQLLVFGRTEAVARAELDLSAVVFDLAQDAPPGHRRAGADRFHARAAPGAAAGR